MAIKVIYGVSTDGDSYRAVALTGDECWRAVEVEGLFYRPLEDQCVEPDDRWDALLDQLD